MKKTLLILTLLIGCTAMAQEAARIAPPRSTYFERTGDTPEAFAQRRMAAAAQSGPNRVGIPITPAPRVLVIMVNFSDYAFVSTRDNVDSLFNAEHLMTPNFVWTSNTTFEQRGESETGSVRKYFYDQSSGMYNPQFDVVGPVTLSQGYGHYGQNYGSSSSRYAGEMVAEACALVDEQVNFADYDANNDGKVDLVFVYYAGFGENDPPYDDDFSNINADSLVWPHYHNLASAGTNGRGKVFDDKTVNAYECANELDGLYSTPAQPIPAGIGVLVHEYCHGLGLPDLYKTNSATHKTLGKWSILDYGPYNNDMHSPPSLTAYERWFLGWMQPRLLNEPEDITLAPLSEGNEACYFTANGNAISNIVNPGTTPFYILEARKKSGWDIGVPGEGLLLYKISYNSANWNSNNVNNTATAMGVDILEADGLTPTAGMGGYYGKQGDCYPYGALDSIHIVRPTPITEITRNADGSVSFKVCGGSPTPTEILNENENENVNENENEKLVRNGKIYIRKNGKIYTILGHETNL